MLRTNLSTRPFYNERLVFVALAAVALLVAVLTVFNGVRLAALTRQDRALAGQTKATEEQVLRLRQQAARARSGIDREQLGAVVAAAREANALIDQRTFSWTDLLNRLETTLPPDVRIESIAPLQRKDGPLEVRVVVLARRAEDVDAFAEQLEANGGFRRVVSQTEVTTPEGLLEVSLQGEYAAGRPGQTGPAK
jgi:Tfp pilus assembly protein PilN